MDVGPPLVADAQTAELMQPAQCAFDNPAVLPQPAPMRLPGLGQERLDATQIKQHAAQVRVVRPVAKPAEEEAEDRVLNGDDSTVIVPENEAAPVAEDLFDDGASSGNGNGGSGKRRHRRRK